MYKIVAPSRFKKDLRLAIKKRYNIKLLDDIVIKLSNG